MRELLQGQKGRKGVSRGRCGNQGAGKMRDDVTRDVLALAKALLVHSFDFASP